MNNEHGDKLLKLLPMNRLDWKHVAVTSKIDAQGKFWPVGSLPSKIRAARDDESINTIVIADGHDVADLNELKLEEHGKIRSSAIPDCQDSFYHFSEDVDTPSRQKFFLIRAKSFSDACNKLHALEKWRQRKKKSQYIAPLFSIFLLIFIAVSAGYIWDRYYREKTHYYADYVEKFGVPVGIQPLSPKQVKQRTYSWRIKTTGGITGELACVNSFGNLTSPGYSEYRDRPARMKLEYSTEHPNRFPTPVKCYDEFNKLHSEMTRSTTEEKEGHWVSRVKSTLGVRKTSDSTKKSDDLEQNKVVDNPEAQLIPAIFHLPPAGIELYSRTKDAHDKLEGYFVNNPKIKLLTNSDHPLIGHYECIYDDGGNMLQEQYIRDEKQAEDFDGTYGRKYEYDSLGRITKIICLDADYDPMDNKYGLCQKIYSYGEENDPLWGIKTVDWMNVDNQSVCGELGLCHEVAEFDCWGNRVEFRFFCPDADGKSIRSKENVRGVAGERFEIEDGLYIKMYNLDVDDKLCLGMNGIAGWTSEYENGNETKCSFFGIDEQPCLINDGYAGWNSKYDDKGNGTRMAYFGIDGQPCLSNEEIAGWIAEYDNKDNKTRMAYFGIDGQPCLINDGYAGWISEYENGNETKCSFFGIDEQPCLINDGYAGWISEYENSNETKRSFFGTDDLSTFLGGDDPYDSWEKTYHDNGEVATQTWFYSVKRHPYGDFAKWINTYDAKGNQIRRAYFGIDGQPCLHNDGNAGWTAEYDKGSKTRMAYFGIDGEPCLIDDGYAGWNSGYNDEGNEIRRAFFGINDEPVPLTGDNPYDSWEKTWHENGEAVTLTLFYRVKEHPDGYAKETAKFDELGNIIEIAYFGIDGQPCLHIYGHAKMTMKYDERGNIIGVACYGIDGKPAALEGNDPYDSWEKTYHENGEVATQTWFYYVKEHPDGYAKVTMEYDDRGNEIEQTYFGIDGKPTALEGDDPYDSSVKTWHENGEVATQTWFYRIKEHPDGYAKRTVKIDERGNIIEQAYFGIDGKLCLIHIGYAKVTMKYDEQGNIIEAAYYGVDDKPAALEGDDPYDSWMTIWHDNGKVATQTWFYSVKRHPEGYAKATVKHDEQGNPIEVAFFGIDDKPYLYKDGYAKVTTKCDEQGNIIEVAYYGVDDKPAALAGDDPYDSVKTTYHENGEVATQTWFYRVKEHPDGYASEEFKFDMDGKRTEQVYRDTEGNQLETRPKVVEADKNSYAEVLGIQPGDYFLDYDDIVFQMTDHFIDHRENETENGSAKKLRVLRGNEILTFEVKPGKLGCVLQTAVRPPIAQELQEK